MPAARRRLVVALTLTLCACSTTPLPRPTPAPLPLACLAPCPPIPALTDGSLPGLRRWAATLIDLYGACRLAHADCAAARAPTAPD